MSAIELEASVLAVHEVVKQVVDQLSLLVLDSVKVPRPPSTSPPSFYSSRILYASNYMNNIQRVLGADSRMRSTQPHKASSRFFSALVLVVFPPPSLLRGNLVRPL